MQSVLPEAKVILFGSRARGDNAEDSDYDLMLITKNNFTDREKLNWRAEINKKLVNTFHISFDVLMNSEEEIKIKQTLSGHIVRWAMKEGIEL